jgi:hypothetical protein
VIKIEVNPKISLKSLDLHPRFLFSQRKRRFLLVKVFSSKNFQKLWLTKLKKTIGRKLTITSPLLKEKKKQNISNLEKVNLQNNPISTKNLDNLTNQQFNQLVNGIKNKKIRVDSFKGTVLMDLLNYAQQLTTSGNNQQQQNAQYLQTLIQHSPIKTNDNQSSNNAPLLIGSLITFGVFILAIGYCPGKKRKNSFEYE